MEIITFVKNENQSCVFEALLRSFQQAFNTRLEQVYIRRKPKMEIRLGNLKNWNSRIGEFNHHIIYKLQLFMLRSNEQFYVRFYYTLNVSKNSDTTYNFLFPRY